MIISAFILTAKASYRVKPLSARIWSPGRKCLCVMKSDLLTFSTSEARPPHAGLKYDMLPAGWHAMKNFTVVAFHNLNMSALWACAMLNFLHPLALAGP